MGETGPSRYKAFLSYSRADAAIARLLQRRLESYALPKGIRIDGEPSLERRQPLRPIFRDEDELVPGGLLPARIEAALRSSDFLIVLCSPSAARSEWVDREVSAFKALEGEDRVIAIVIEGEPNAERRNLPAEQECLPPSLRSRQPSGSLDVDGEHLWVDWRRSTTDRRSFVRVVAALLRIESIDLLIRRDRQAQTSRRIRTIIYALVGLLLFTALLGSIWWLTLGSTAIQEQRFDRYFATYVASAQSEFEGIRRAQNPDAPVDEVPWGAEVISRQVGDLNGDGISDAIAKYVSFQLCGNSVCQDIFLGRPDGSFYMHSNRDDLYQHGEMSLSTYDEIRIRPRPGEWSDIIARIAGESGSYEILSLWRYSDARKTYLPIGHMLRSMVFCSDNGDDEQRDDLVGASENSMPVRYYAPYDGVISIRRSVDNPRQRLLIDDENSWYDAGVGLSEDGRWLMLWSRFEGVTYAEFARPQPAGPGCPVEEIRRSLSTQPEISGYIERPDDGV